MTLKFTGTFSTDWRPSSYVDNHDDTPKSRMIDAFLRTSIFPAISLLSAGAGLSASLPHIGKILTLIGYIIFALLLLCLVGAEIMFWTRRSSLRDHSVLVSIVRGRQMIRTCS